MGADMRSQLLDYALIAVAPGLVQDAYMARPESLIYLLTALLIWVLTLDIALTYRLACGGLVLGAGIAVKVTFASAGLLVLVPLAEHWREHSLREWARYGRHRRCAGWVLPACRNPRLRSSRQARSAGGVGAARELVGAARRRRYCF